MFLEYSKKFRKNFAKRIAPNKNLDEKFEVRLKTFLNNPKNPILKNHKLSGSKRNLMSFSITGDVRVTYYLKDDTVYFFDIGTHNQVY